MNCELILNILSIIFSAAAAILWLLSAFVKLPGKTKIGLGELNKGVRKQAKLNAFAAMCACIVATLQVILFII